MERRLIPDSLQTAAGVDVEGVRTLTNTPPTWRLCPSLTAFYNPDGMTQAEIDAYDAMQLGKIATRESLAPATLAMLGIIIRGRNVNTWNGWTVAQRKQAVNNEATIFKTMREFFNNGA